MVKNKEVLSSQLPSNFALEYAIRALQETQLDTADDVTLLGTV